jgi:plasmid stability protein
MPTTITLKGIPDDVYQRLKQSADANRRSVNSEIIVCLETQLLPRKAPATEHLAAIRALRARLAPAAFNHGEIDRLKREGRP